LFNKEKLIKKLTTKFVENHQEQSHKKSACEETVTMESLPDNPCYSSEQTMKEGVHKGNESFYYSYKSNEGQVFVKKV